MNFVERWKKIAESKNLTMKEVCAKVGVDTSTIQRWKTHLPKALRVYFAIEKELSKK